MKNEKIKPASEEEQNGEYGLKLNGCRGDPKRVEERIEDMRPFFEDNTGLRQASAS